MTSLTASTAPTCWPGRGPGGGPESGQTGGKGRVRAGVRPAGASPGGQWLLALPLENRDQPGGVVDLGSTLGSTDVPRGGGGYAPTGPPRPPPLIARAL